ARPAPGPRSLAAEGHANLLGLGRRLSPTRLTMAFSQQLDAHPGQGTVTRPSLTCLAQRFSTQLAAAVGRESNADPTQWMQPAARRETSEQQERNDRGRDQPLARVPTSCFNMKLRRNASVREDPADQVEAEKCHQRPKGHDGEADSA